MRWIEWTIWNTYSLKNLKNPLDIGKCMLFFHKNPWLVRKVLVGQTVKKFEWSMTGQPVTNSPPY